MNIKEKTVKELKTMLDNEENFQLIDVREPVEHEFTDIGGELIPVGDFLQNLDKVAKDKPVILYCRSGKRSANVIQLVQDKYSYQNLYNLKGGILAYADEIDDSIKKYSSRFFIKT